MEVAQRSTLRMLATKIGVIETGARSFSIPRDTLIEKLSEAYPGIGEMSDADVTGILGELAEEKPAAAKGKVADKAPATKAGPAKPGPKGPAKAPKPVVEEPAAEEPAAEEEPAVEPEPVEAKMKAGPAKPGPAKAGPAAAKPGPASPTKPGPAKAPVKAAEPESASTSDLAPVIERIDTLGKMLEKAGTSGDAQGRMLGSLSNRVDALIKDVSSILGYLTWQYNNTVDNASQVKSISDIEW